MELEEILEEIRTRPTVPLWPHAAMALGVSRGSAYAAASRGEIDTIRIGRSIRAVSASLRRRLGLKEQSSASSGAQPYFGSGRRFARER
jgi:hypothetical protein